MANTKKLSLINDAAMGEYRIEAYDSRKYNAVFYSIRELYGKVAQRQLGEAFDWETFKQHFEISFGKAEERKYTMEQLLAFAKDKFDYSLEKLIEYNQRSWQRREQRLKQQATYRKLELVEQPATGGDSIFAAEIATEEIA
ncbi:hypothetical protein C7Y66_15825 [Chroococcidiopsis sp. CCALA 051]|uniref:hypothetical protein n=1 Tax=Chroococcidiopsis sp. CCALA 051 TaxID=869949 RepID=UPI000D0CD52F|nr:hypothetical protein [Chroococcidiopsis sp. CCALA 051]PSM48204.1 hypothetical protein C7Y66_15825 [Chroococcidiopsis sp. CCALA 051]